MERMEPSTLAQLLRRRVAAGPLLIDVSGVSMGRRMVGARRVEAVRARRPVPGQVWVFVTEEGRLVAHRCLMGGRRPRFQGDANSLPDGPVPPSCLVGRVSAVETAGGWKALGIADRLCGVVVLGRHLLAHLRRHVGRR